MKTKQAQIKADELLRWKEPKIEEAMKRLLDDLNSNLKDVEERAISDIDDVCEEVEAVG